MSSPLHRRPKGGKLSVKFTGVHSRASDDLRRLQSLLAKNNPRQEVGEGSGQSSISRRAGKYSQHTAGPRGNISSELSELERFSLAYKDQRTFSDHPLSKLFAGVFTALVKNRLRSEWIDCAPPEWVFRVLVCLRLFVRDPNYQTILHQLHGIHFISKYLESVTEEYLSRGEQEFASQSLVTMTYIFQKLSATENQRVWILESGAHTSLAKLLHTRDCGVLQGALLALTVLAESPKCKEVLAELPLVESLLLILREYDPLSKRMSAELLRLLSPVPAARGQLRDLEGVPVLLSLLHGHGATLLWSVAWVLVQLCEDPEARAEIRNWGGVQQLLRLLHRKEESPDRSSSTPRASEEPSRSGEAVDNTVALQSACCAALTEMSLDDFSAQQIVEENGIFTLGKLLLQQDGGAKTASLQCYVFRSLRFLYSVERNRALFKRVFPTELFQMFVDVGHYVRDLAAYEGLQTAVSQYTDVELEALRDGIRAADQNRPAARVISGYSVLDHLGSGAFGSVFKVQKQSGQSFLALKEVNLHNPAFGKDKRSRDSNVEKIISELTIIKEQMVHPNIVKYYKTFLEGERLYIVMELIEGRTLAEHLHSLEEKQQRLTEERIWNVFIQACLALRYLHKEKRIVHRDLSPNNIMLGDKDKVTITDFGLAKQKQENSKLTSMVGSILYSCPEVVKNEPYGEKADVWALGCVLYQMVALRPPFFSGNMLSLANKIVEASYEPLEEGIVSERVTDMIGLCLTPDPEQRPDIVAVSSRISDLMMRLMDGLYSCQSALKRQAQRQRTRAQKSSADRRAGVCVDLHSSGGRVLLEERLSERADSPARSSSAACSSERGERSFSRGVKSCFCASPDDLLAAGDFCISSPKQRPVSAGICLSQKTLRQIDDPVQKLLTLLHKLLFITQLPPAPQRCTRRRLVEKFKTSLFQRGSDPSGLKTELSKLLRGSSELLDVQLTAFDCWSAMQLSVARDPATSHGADGVTYQQMQEMLEELLEENGYYRTTESD